MNPPNLEETRPTERKKKIRTPKEDLSYYYEHHRSCKSILDFLSGGPRMTDLEDQIFKFKMLISGNELSVRCQDEAAIELFLDMVYRLDSGLEDSPLKTVILRYFSNQLGPIRTKSEEHLLKFVMAKVLDTSSDDDAVGKFVAFLMPWLVDASNIGACLKPGAAPIIYYLESALDKLLSKLTMEMSPTAKLKVLEDLHNVVRCLMMFSQKVAKIYSLNLQNRMLHMVSDDQLPLDLRSNCGILYVSISKHITPRLLCDKVVDTTFAPDKYQARLCICGGLLNVLNEEDLEEVVMLHEEGYSLLHFLLSKIISIEESNPADCTLILSASRCIQLVTKRLVSSPHMLTEKMLNSLLNYLWVHLDHNMDVSRHLAASSLANVVSAGNKLESAIVTNAILNGMGVLASDNRSKHAALGSLIGILPVHLILSKVPGLVNTLLESAKNSNSRNGAVGTFEALMSRHFEEKSSLAEWYNLWVNPVIKLFGDGNNPALDHVLTTMVKIEPSVLQHIACLKKENPDELMGIFLVAWRIGKKLALLDETSKNYPLDQRIYQLLIHRNFEFKIALFAVIIEAPKTTQAFSEYELDIVKEFLKRHMKIQSDNERQRMLAYFKKFITRFKLGFDYCLRVTTKGGAVESTTYLEMRQRLETAENFSKWLVQFCLDNLFPGANFSRRVAALRMLTDCAEHGLWGIGFWEDYQTERNVAVLLRCCLDSFEENKRLAQKLLMAVPARTLKFDCPDYVKGFMENSMKLSVSTKPTDSQSAAYFVSLLATFASSNDGLSVVLEGLAESPRTNTKKIPESGRYLCVIILLKKLKQELEVARLSLLKAASTGPMYGQLVVLNHLFREVDFSVIVKSEEWKIVIQDIITTAFECDQVVSPVVNNSSPEGHLPMDFDYDMNEFAQENPGVRVTAQMLLLCSWRTTKEVSLLLGELSERTPLSTNENPGLVSENQLLAIGEHLNSLLAKTKHRGAFEQAYVGFCKLVTRLWRVPEGNLHELPRRWLDETLADITNDQNLSATRRSAGIPLKIKALVSTELEVGGTQCFQRAINELLQLASDPSSSVETKCHALNVLRALYSHTLLGEMVSPYVAKGFTVAIEGFNASTFAERNSSTLLFSALMTRVFGVPRSRSDELCWKNKMTGRIFFQRYPSLFGVLLGHLEAASQKPLYPATYPVLLILGRLYPSSLDGTDSNLQLHMYVPLVFKCSGSNILKTRTLAASAMAALITQNTFVKHIEEVFEMLGGIISENLMHGLLLQVLKLFHSPVIPENVDELIKNNLRLWISQLTGIITSYDHSFVTKSTCVLILLHWTMNYFPIMPADLLENIKRIVTSRRRNEYGMNVYKMYSSALVLTLDYYRQEADEVVNSILSFLDAMNCYEVRNVVVRFIHCVLRNSYRFTLLIDDSCEIVLRPSSFGETLKAALVRAWGIAEWTLDSLEDNADHHENILELYNIVSLWPNILPRVMLRRYSPIDYFGELCENKPEIFRRLSFQCLTKDWPTEALIRGGSWLETDWARLCRLIDQSSSPDAEKSCRAAVAEFLKAHWLHLDSIPMSLENRMMLRISMLRLLEDDDCGIRETVSDVFGPMLHSNTALEYFFYGMASNDNNYDVSPFLLRCVIGDVDLADDGDCSDRVFDKGDANAYSEEMILYRVASASIRLADRHYYYDYEGVEHLLPFKGKTQSDIMRSFKTHVQRLCSQTNLPSPFRPNEERLCLMEEKLRMYF